MADNKVIADGKGERKNTGKLRYDLEHPVAREGLVRVLTKGAQKYAERNWERGMKWTKVIASAERHLAALKRGEDYDIDVNCPDCQKSTKDKWVCTNHTGELHADLLQCNAHFISAYYKIFPQGDDRIHKHLSPLKIGLDIDEVLCNWVGAWMKKWNITNVPTSWFFQRGIVEKFEQMRKDGELDSFYLGLEPLIKPEDIPFEPHCYITSRPVSTEITEQWLDKHGFPTKPVYTVDSNTTKVEVAKKSGIDIFVDDRYENFVELNNAGICTYLYDSPHNQRYNVGFKRIKSLKELM